MKIRLEADSNFLPRLNLLLNIGFQAPVVESRTVATYISNVKVAIRSQSNFAVLG